MSDDAAWAAVVQKGKERHYGTSEADVNAYGAAGGAAAATAVCVAYGAEAASPLCAAIGGKVGAAVTSAIQGIGKNLFGGSDFLEPNDVWNPVADGAIKAIVVELRKHKGLEVTAPPGGSARNYPEWNGVAARWAARVNEFVAARGGPIVWFYERGQPGRIRGEAVTQWEKCGRKKQYAMVPPPPTRDCVNAKGESASKYLPEAVVRATQDTAFELLRPSRAWLYGLLGAAALGAAWWKLRK